MERAALAHAHRAKNVAGVSITYKRDTTSFAFIAWLATNTSARDGAEAIVPITSERDYMIMAMDLGELGVPQRGDRILQTINGEDREYEVTPPSNGDPCWTYQGNSESMFRVYTRRVD